jgi:predicted RNase H-like nuclease (RuvC/YqgF family)
LEGLHGQTEKELAKYQKDLVESQNTISAQEQKMEYMEKEIQDLKVELSSFNRDYYEKILVEKGLNASDLVFRN